MIPYAAAADLLPDVAAGIAPPIRMRVSESATKHVKVKYPSGAIDTWSSALTPYMIEPMDMLESRGKQAVVFIGPAQSGKTQGLIDCWVGHCITCSPADMMIIQATQSVARDFERDRWRKLKRYSPSIAARISVRGHDDNTYDKTLVTGDTIYLKWPSENEIQGKSLRRMALTDYDRMPLNIGGQGSAFELARKRTRKFRSLGMTLAESSPGYEQEDPNWRPSSPHEAPPAKGIFALYNLGDRRRLYWPCPHCGEYFMPPPGPEYFLYDVSRDLFDHVIPESLGDVKIPCTCCGQPIEERQKQPMLDNTIWVPDGCRILPDRSIEGEPPDTDIASYWLHGVHAAYASWRGLILSYLQALKVQQSTGDEQSMRTVILQDFAAAFISQTRQTMRDTDQLASRREPFARGVVPPGVRFLLAKIDVQGGHKRRFVVQIAGYGIGSESWLIDRFSLRYLDEDKQIRLDMHANIEHWDVLIDHVITRTYPLADDSGRRMPVHLTLCDSGGEDGVTDRAYSFNRSLRPKGLSHRFLLVKGASSRSAPKTELRRPNTSARKDRKIDSRGDVPVLFLNTNLLKDALSNNLARTEPGPGYMHFPLWVGDWFFDELNGEKRQTDGTWDKVSANEAFDLYNYGLAALHHLGIEKMDWDHPRPWALPWNENPEIIPADNDANPADLEPLPPQSSRRVRFRQAAR